MGSTERSNRKGARSAGTLTSGDQPESNAIAWVADATTWRFTHVSKEAEEILGYPVRRWIEEPTFWQEHLHPDDREWAISTCLRNSQLKRPYEFEYRMLARNGRIVWLWDAVQVVVRQGKPVELFGVMVDITQRKRKEQALQEQAETWKSVVTQMPEFVLRVALDGTILFINKVVPGLILEEVIGSSLYEYVPITEAGRVKSMIEQAIRTEKPVYYKTVGMGPHHSLASYSARVTPVFTGGRVESVMLVAQDITETEPPDVAS